MENYQVYKTIGDGSFGTVFKASNIKTGEVVAIKKMKTKYATWDECINLRELKSLRKLTHPNIIKLKEAIKVKDELHFVFEFLDQNLYQLYNNMLQKGKHFNENEIRSIIYQTTLGLAHMHKHGFFHRDLKPENLLYHKECVKIADLGLAREIRSRPPYTDYVATRWYRAPEILLKSTNYNSPVDIFALGCIMAELYTLSPLFKGNSEMDQLYKICSVLGTPNQNAWTEGYRLAANMGVSFPQCSPVPLHTIIPNACDDALQLIFDMLKYDANKRPSAQQVLQHPYFASYVHIERPYTPQMIEGSPTLTNKRNTRDESPARINRASEYSNKRGDNTKDSVLETYPRNNTNKDIFYNRETKEGLNNSAIKVERNNTVKNARDMLGGLTASSILDELTTPGLTLNNNNKNTNMLGNNLNINLNNSNYNMNNFGAANSFNANNNNKKVSTEADTPTRLLEEEINQALESFKQELSVDTKPNLKAKDPYVGSTGLFNNGSMNNFGNDNTKSGLYLPTKEPGFGKRGSILAVEPQGSGRYDPTFDKPNLAGGKVTGQLGPSLYDFGKKKTNASPSPDLYIPSVTKPQQMKYSGIANTDNSFNANLYQNSSAIQPQASNNNLYNFSSNQGGYQSSMGGSVMTKPNLMGKNANNGIGAGTRGNLSLGGGAYNMKIDAMNVNNIMNGDFDISTELDNIAGLGKYKY